MSDQYPNTDEVRKWAQSKPSGATVSNMGRLPRFVILAWDKAHPGRPFVKSQAYHGTSSGSSRYGCSCARCASAKSEQNRNYYAAGGAERWES